MLLHLAVQLAALDLRQTYRVSSVRVDLEDAVRESKCVVILEKLEVE